MRAQARTVMLAISLSALPMCLLAQVEFGSISINLGQSRAAVLSQLRQWYRVDSSGTDEDFWTVENKDGSSPSWPHVAGIEFTSGRLTYVHKSWTPWNPWDPSSLTEAIMGALRTLERSSAPCSVTSSTFPHADSTSSQPDLTLSATEVVCGPHSVRISVSKSHGVEPQTMVDELLRSTR
jgi:hypothetical protein